MESSNSTGDRLGRPPAGPARPHQSALSRVDLSLADLWVLGALLALTATLGKGFSTLGFPDASIYVTEIGLAASGGLALLRLGPARFVEAIRSRVPLIPLAIFWLAGVVAAVEGIRTVGLTNMLEDIGLGEYSLLVPLIAVVAGSLARAELLTRVLAWGLVGGTIVYAISDVSVRLLDADGTFFDVQEITFGLYMSMLVAYVAARIAGDAELDRAWVVLGGIALVLIFLTNARGVWISVVVALAVVAMLNPRGRRLRAGVNAAAAVVCALGLAIGVQLLGGASGIANEVTGAVRGIEAQEGEGGGGGESGATSAASTEAEDNARWRIAFWGEIASRSVENPVFGVGYGEPIAFVWDGQKYDFRDADPNAAIEVGGPHNEYLHVLYRMGYVGLIALIALIVVALQRARDALRIDGIDPAARSLIVGLTAMWVASATVSFFADALKAPFLGLFFWASLGLLAAAAAGVRDASASSAGAASARNASG